jgi:predicted transcriptional regulator
MHSDIQNNLIREILSINDTGLLKKLEELMMILKQNDSKVLTDYERAIVENGISEVNEGKYLTNEEVFEKAKQWLKM